jgi:hypothetical protein
VPARQPDTDGDVDDVTAHLYGLPPEEFTAARAEAVAQARRAGDRQRADRIGALRKPTTVGWLANQLVRERGEEIHALLRLGESLREATAELDREQLRQLSRQQHQVVYALVQQARGIANAAGRPASSDTARGLEDTLHAALADPDAAAQLAEGRLIGALSRSGFPVGDRAPREAAALAPVKRATGAPAKISGAKSATTGTQTKHADAARAKRLSDAQRDEQDARAEADAAVAVRERAQLALKAALDAGRDADDRVDELAKRLDEAVREQTEAQRVVRAARRELRQADQFARSAQRRATDAAARRERLAG